MINKYDMDHSPGGAQYVCSFCDLVFPSYKRRYTHSRKEHAEHFQGKLQLLRERKEYKCQVCGAAFTSLRSTSRHIRSTHPDSIPPPEEPSEERNKFKCSVCDEKFYCRSTRSRHMKSEHGEYVLERERCAAERRIFNCSYCPKTFQSNQRCRIHCRTVHADVASPEVEEPKPFDCFICGKLFKSRAGRWHHEKHCSRAAVTDDENCFSASMQLLQPLEFVSTEMGTSLSDNPCANQMSVLDKVVTQVEDGVKNAYEVEVQNVPSTTSNTSSLLAIAQCPILNDFDTSFTDDSKTDQNVISDVGMNQCATPRTPTSRPRKLVHLKQFSTPDVSTPKHARLFLDMSHRILDEKNKKILILQQTVRRLKRKIAMLETHITESLAENITVCKRDSSAFLISESNLETSKTPMLSLSPRY